MKDTAGNEVVLLPDICPYCLPDTGGGHEIGCPCFEKSVMMVVSKEGES